MKLYDDLHLESLIGLFLLEKKADGMAKRTQKEYGKVLDRFQRWCRDHQCILAEDLNPRHILEYAANLRDTRWAEATIAYHIRPVRAWLSWLYQNQLTETNLAKTIKAPETVIRSESIPTLEEIGLALNVPAGNPLLDLRDRAIILMMLDTGVRVGELTHLTVQNWTCRAAEQRSEMLVYASKTRKTRTACCAELSTLAMAAYLKARGKVSPQDSLFVGNHNRPLTTSGIDHMLRRRAAQAGLPSNKLHPHIWRKAFATYAAENGMDPTVLLTLGGWSSMEMLKTYIQNNPRRIADMHTRTSPVDNGLKKKKN